jgi:hypothetical protein
MLLGDLPEEEFFPLVVALHFLKVEAFVVVVGVHST